jgi:Acetyltransferase (GNAT) domain
MIINNFKIIDPSEIKNWDELILNFPDYSFFHSSSWSNVMRDTYNYTPSYFVIIENGILKAAVPLMIVNSSLTGNRAVSLPFSDYCEPLLQKEVNFGHILEGIKNICIGKKLKYLELRGGKNFLNEVERSSFDYNHTLDLTVGKEALFKNLSSSTKRNIKKAVRESVSVEISNSVSALEDFYKMNCVTRKKHGLPPQPKRFFKNLYKHVILKNEGFIALGKYNGTSIGSALYLHIGKKALYKFGASYMEFQTLRANNLIMWEVIKYYASNGYGSFSFGRTEPENDGLRRFKLGFGTHEEELHIYKYDFTERDFLPLKTKTTGLHNKIFNKTPLPILKIFGLIFYRHFG